MTAPSLPTLGVFLVRFGTALSIGKSTGRQRTGLISLVGPAVPSQTRHGTSQDLSRVVFGFIGKNSDSTHQENYDCVKNSIAFLPS